MPDDEAYDDDADLYGEDAYDDDQPRDEVYDDDREVVTRDDDEDVYEEEAYGTEYDRDVYEEEDEGSWWDEGLIGLLLVAGVVLFLFPEPSTSALGMALIAVGVIAWAVDALT